MIRALLLSEATAYAVIDGAKGLLPVAREGERIVGSKRVLREHYLYAVSGKRGASPLGGGAA